LLYLLKDPVASVQDFCVLTGRAFRNIVRRPHYIEDIFLQIQAAWRWWRLVAA
jgi:hypothetical protein